MSTNEEQLIPFRPYLLRAAYDWMVDNHLTPYIAVNANYPGARVPIQYVKNGAIILDITPRAIHRLKISNEVVEFEARFGNKVNFISIPIPAISSIYSHECGHSFPLSGEYTEKPVPSSPTLSISTATPGENQEKETGKSKIKPKFTLVKTETKDNK